MSPTTNGKRGNSIYYTWKTFFKATRQKGRLNTDIYNILQLILRILRQCFVLTFQSKRKSIVSSFINKTIRSLIFHSFFVQIIVMITFFDQKKWVSWEFKLFVDKQFGFMKEDIALSQNFLLVS